MLRFAEFIQARPVPVDLALDEVFDLGDVFAVVGGDEGEGGAEASGASGAADAMDVIFRMGRHVEIKDVADIGNVEATRRNVGTDEDVHRAILEGVERSHAGRLVHVAMQGANRKAMLVQALVNNGDVALAVAEHNGVLQAFDFAQQPAQGLALVAAAMRGDQRLGDGGDDGGGAGHFDAGRIM